MEKLLILWLAAANLTLLICMGRDKMLAKEHRRRIPETTLLMLAVVGGSIGGILGMLCFRHKTRKPAFFLGFPLIALCQFGLGAYLFLIK